MPQVFKIGPYWVYFWTNEGRPAEPVHIHISPGGPSENATKVWITKAGKCLLCHNNSQIPPPVLRRVLRVIESRSGEILEKWLSYFGEVSYYC